MVTTHKRKQALVLPTLSIADMKIGDSLCVKIISDISHKTKLDKEGNPSVDPETKKEIIIHTVAAINLETGEQGEMVLPHIVMNAFEKIKFEVKNKAFELVKGKKKNRTNEWQVYELELDPEKPAK